MYLLDLDEVSEKALREQLDKRAMLRRDRLCDYCGRPPDSDTCKFPGRHVRMLKKFLAEKARGLR